MRKITGSWILEMVASGVLLRNCVREGNPTMVDLIEKAKRSCNILEIVKRYVDLKKVGSYWRGFCPFHVEKEPSFFVDERRQMFKCFGCGAGGDVVAFVARLKGVRMAEAAVILMEEMGVLEVRGRENNVEVGKEREYGFPVDSLDLREIMGTGLWKEVEWFSERHRIKLEDMLEMKWRWWRGRLVIPCWKGRKREEYAFWFARSISDVVEPRYINSRGKKWVWGLDWYNVGEDGVLWITEGWKDAYRMEGIAILGKELNAVQRDVLKGLIGDGVKRVCVVMDRDAFREAVKVGMELSRLTDIPVLVGRLKTLKDPGEALEKKEVVDDIEVYDVRKDKFLLIKMVRENFRR